MAKRWARVGKIGTKRLKTGPSLPNFTPRWGRKGARWTPRRARRAQEQPSLPQDGPSWPKMEQEGGKMGTQRGQEGAREAQVGPKSGQKKKDPDFYDFWISLGPCFGGRFGIWAVF